VELLGEGAADAGAASGDEDGVAGEIHITPVAGCELEVEKRTYVE
jgi:hypothetical protein